MEIRCVLKTKLWQPWQLCLNAKTSELMTINININVYVCNVCIHISLAGWFEYLTLLSTPWALNILHSVLHIYFLWLLMIRWHSKENSTDSSEKLTLFYKLLCLFFEYKHPKFLSCKIPVPFHQVPQCPGLFLGLLKAWYPHLMERSPARVWGWERECFWFGAAQMINLSFPPLGQPSLAMGRNKKGYSGTLAETEGRCCAISKLLKHASDIFLPTTSSTHVHVDVRGEALPKVSRARPVMLTTAWESDQVWL